MRGDAERAARWHGERKRLGATLEQAWDGDWYRRAYFDDGTPLGSAQGQECRVDSVSQSWAVLSGAAPQGRAERAMDAVRTQLVRRDAGVIQLLAPPFDQSPLDPGYIEGYLPGVRENGGQYTQAALWAVMAIAHLGNGDEAVELFHMLNPINHSRTRADVERYKVEPYVVVADVYTHPAHMGRGGRWRYGRSVNEITVENPERRNRGVAEAVLNGARVDARAIPLVDDGGANRLRVVMGETAKAREAHPIQISIGGSE